LFDSARHTPRAVVAIVALLVGMFGTAPARAFTAQTRSAIVEKAVRLMPAALARQLRRHGKVLHSGALDGLERTGLRREVSDRALIGRAIEAESRRAVQLIDAHAPMREVARSFGRLAQLISDLSFALNVVQDEARESEFFDDYCKYVERSLPKIATTFAGFPHPQLAAGDLPGFTGTVAERAALDYAGIVRSYYPPGRARHPSDFDDRSVAYASASLEVSLAITSTAQLWLYVWHRAGGDLTGTPFLASERQAEPFQPAPRTAP
jgi:hypothetical protein